MRFKAVAHHVDMLGKHYKPPYFVEWREDPTSFLGEKGYHVFATPTDPSTGFDDGAWLLFVCLPDGPVEDEETLKANLLMLAETGLWEGLK